MKHSNFRFHLITGILLFGFAAACRQNDPPLTTTLSPTFTSQPPATTPDPWTELAPLLFATSEMPAVWLDGEIITVGGFISNVGSVTITDRAAAYNPNTDTWRELAPLPEARHHGMAAAYGGQVYFFGGSPPPSFGPTANAWAYDPTTDTWREIAPLPEPRTAGAAVVLDEAIYVVGGAGNFGQETPLLRYDPSSDTWVELAPVLENREHVPAVAFNGQIWAVGGRYEGELASVEIYDPTTDSWTEGPVLQEVRAGHAAAVLDNRLYVFGGEVFQSRDAAALTSVEVYDEERGVWGDAAALPIPLHGVPAVTGEGLIYVVGGSTIAAAAANSGRLFAFQP
jgi:N-acetylneuraminic acid mutarotase